MSDSNTKIQRAGGKSGRGLLGLFALILVLFAANVIYGFIQTKNANERTTRAQNLQVVSQQIAKNASEASQGNKTAFEALDSATARFASVLAQIKEGDSTAQLPALTGEGTNELGQVEALWDDVEVKANTILANREQVLQLYEVAENLGTTIPQLQSEYTTVVDILLDSNSPAEQVHLATRQGWFAERISSSMQKVLQGGDEAELAAENFGHDVEVFGQVLNGMLEGDNLLEISRVRNAEARDALTEISSLYDGVRDRVDYIIENTPQLFSVHQASDQVFVETTELLNRTDNLAATFEQNISKSWIGAPEVSAGLLLLAALLFLVYFLQTRRAEKARLEDTNALANLEKEQNDRNQEAIIRLLDEMEGLADGDLTVNTTVTEDFTGAIADAFNYTIDQLRNLVSTINLTASRVAEAATSTQQSSVELAEASRQQAQEITGASAAINEMAVSIEQVSGNASESSQVAEKSVEIAKNGGEVVRNTIRGMDTIREQIQETSKRIKRLGESSQEIGNIVSLINDIADQTNILALNAAIQASAAGEAGRGFAVVADEVQRLAERSGNATKQIEALVKTIQTDTNEAVISMEDTTSEVVRGARLAQDAGVALEEIEQVSSNLADLIQNISNAARQQAASAGHVSNTMNVIQEITTQTSESTQETTRSIGELAALADELQQTVAGFKLPSQQDVEAAAVNDDDDDDFYEEFEEIKDHAEGL